MSFGVFVALVHFAFELLRSRSFTIWPHKFAVPWRTLPEMLKVLPGLTCVLDAFAVVVVPIVVAASAGAATRATVATVAAMPSPTRVNMRDICAPFSEGTVPSAAQHRDNAGRRYTARRCNAVGSCSGVVDMRGARSGCVASSGPTLTVVHPRGDMDVVLTRACDGDEYAFAELYRHLQQRLLRYVQARYGVSVEDVVAETWASVARDLHRFSGGFADFQRWVFTIARARAIDELRRAARAAIPVEDLPAPALHPSAEHEALHALDGRDVLALVRCLPPDQADAVAARVLAGLDVASAAQLLGKSAVSVRVNTHRGLRRLAQLIPVEMLHVVA